MPTVTTDALTGLLYIYNGLEVARWNYVDAVGTSSANPGGIGNGVSLTYSFLSSRPAWASADEVDVGVLNAPMKAGVIAALDHIAEIADITFTQDAPQAGQITFATSFQTSSSAWAYTPYFYQTTSSGEITSVTEDKLAGSVWINNDIPWVAADWQPKAFGYATLLHEMGHALGLKHPFEGDGAGGFVLDESVDNEAHTVMSYTSAPRTVMVVDFVSGPGGTSWNYDFLSPSTMMMMDIEALQHLYGANTATRSGNTVYDFDTNEELLETIWDGGGRDTLDCSNQTLTCRINLGDGEFSSIGLRRNDAEMKVGFDLPASFDFDDVTAFDRTDLYNGQNNLGIAKGAIIENATGGSASDVIIGNDVANRLVGGIGKDKLTGGFGNDRLDGGVSADTLSGQGGADVLVGGGGADTMNGGGGRDVFDYNRLNDTGSTAGTADTITGFVSGEDRIDLRTLDANAALGGNQAFTFIEANPFSGNATGQVRFEAGFLYGSTDSDMAAEFVIKLAGVDSITAGDLLL
jgi:serralysin